MVASLERSTFVRGKAKEVGKDKTAEITKAINKAASYWDKTSKIYQEAHKDAFGDLDITPEHIKQKRAQLSEKQKQEVEEDSMTEEEKAENRRKLEEKRA